MGSLKQAKMMMMARDAIFFPLVVGSGKMIPFDEGSEGSEASWRNEKKDGQ